MKLTEPLNRKEAKEVVLILKDGLADIFIQIFYCIYIIVERYFLHVNDAPEQSKEVFRLMK